MKRVYKNWLVRITVVFAAITSMRLISTALHMTTLERLYKPRDFRKTSHLKISPEIIDNLPKFSQTVIGQKMDPINLIFVGTESGIKRAFEKAGWSTANPASPVHMLLAFFSTVFNTSHKTGPFTPHFINIGLQDLSFQKLTKLNSFRQRHHVRIWRTKNSLPNDHHIWIAAASFDKSLRVDILPPFVHHHIDPDLDREREFIIAEMVAQGHKLGDSHQMNKKISDKKAQKNATGAPYFTDGKAQVIEIV
jgi:hypothetical protein